MFTLLSSFTWLTATASRASSCSCSPIHPSYCNYNVYLNSEPLRAPNQHWFPTAIRINKYKSPKCHLKFHLISAPLSNFILLPSPPCPQLQTPWCFSLSYLLYVPQTEQHGTHVPPASTLSHHRLSWNQLPYFFPILVWIACLSGTLHQSHWLGQVASSRFS